MANIHFERKACSDELRETLFFATGEVPAKDRQAAYVALKTSGFNIKIVGFKNIMVNGKRLNSLTQARYEIQRIVME